MKYCENCKKQILDEWNFCAYCGGSLSLICSNPDCGKPIEKDFTVCPYCGLKTTILVEQQADEIYSSLEELPGPPPTIDLDLFSESEHFEKDVLKSDLNLETDKPEIKYPLRKTPLSLSSWDEINSAFHLDKNDHPIEYVKNDFVDKHNGVIVDRATGLMWQKSSSGLCDSEERIELYINHCNKNKYAGFNDWRIPTISELISLVDPEIIEFSHSHLNPIFAFEFFDSTYSSDLIESNRLVLNEKNLKVTLSIVAVVRLVRSCGNSGQIMDSIKKIDEKIARFFSESTITSGTTLPQTPRRFPLKVFKWEIESRSMGKAAFGIDDEGRPITYIKNRFADNGDETVTDQEIGLMWQNSRELILCEDVSHATRVIFWLNNSKYKGYQDWRLPTVAELLTLKEANIQKNDLYINPVFSHDPVLMSADILNEMGEPWRVRYDDTIYSVDSGYGVSIRAVRNITHEKSTKNSIYYYLTTYQDIHRFLDQMPSTGILRKFAIAQEPKEPKLSIRKEPITSEHIEQIKQFPETNLDDNCNWTITDYASGLKWRQNPIKVNDGSYLSYLLFLNEIQSVQWRLPTVPELFELAAENEEDGSIILNSIFGDDPWDCKIFLSADKDERNEHWCVEYPFAETVNIDNCDDDVFVLFVADI
jgi:hypothetical protein